MFQNVGESFGDLNRSGGSEEIGEFAPPTREFGEPPLLLVEHPVM